jgi:predicted  nucleic acid-binding Zn-ribbon protein
MNQAQSLHHLQSLDQQISQSRSRLEIVEQLLGENTRVLTAEQAAASAEADVAPWRNRVRDLDLEIRAITGKASAVEDRLYSGKVTNPKELKDMQDEIESLKRHRGKLEDDLLEAMIGVESGNASLGKARNHLEAERSAWQSEQVDLEAERAALQSTLATLRAERAIILPEIEPRNLEVYKRLFRSKNGQGVSVLIDTSCGGCGVGQTTSVVQQIRQARELVFCSNCGRILTIL